MIVKRYWFRFRRTETASGFGRDKWRVTREGWFLFGIVPLYVRDRALEQVG